MGRVNTGKRAAPPPPPLPLHPRCGCHRSTGSPVPQDGHPFPINLDVHRRAAEGWRLAASWLCHLVMASGSSSGGCLPFLLLSSQRADGVASLVACTALGITGHIHSLPILCRFCARCYSTLVKWACLQHREHRFPARSFVTYASDAHFAVRVHLPPHTCPTSRILLSIA